jgi:serine/threonine-protein kinase
MLACPRCGAAYGCASEFCSLDGSRLVDEDRDFLVGHIVDQYQLLERIAEGGTGRVYRARDIFSREEVAIKILYGHLAGDRTATARFRREARAAAFIHHPNVITVHHHGTSAEGLCFTVMEYLRGRTLAEALTVYGYLPIPHALDIARQVASGLAAAHALNLVHRDLKPSNIMLVGDGRSAEVKILDFGLVGKSSEEERQARLTSPGQVFGTPAYMAPEQIMGGAIDARTDLYALGVVLYEMLSGAPPFTGDVKQVLCQHMAVPPQPIAHAGPAGILAVHLLEKEPGQRPSTSISVVHRVEELELAYVLAARPDSVHAKALVPRAPARRPSAPRLAAMPASAAPSQMPAEHEPEQTCAESDEALIRAALGRGVRGRAGIVATVIAGAMITALIYALTPSAPFTGANPPSLTITPGAPAAVAAPSSKDGAAFRALRAKLGRTRGRSLEVPRADHPARSGHD